jgi:3-oxoacyl-[acyl-carrier-protein] synthase-1
LKVYTVADYILSPLAGGTEYNFAQILAGHTGIKKEENRRFSDTPFYAATITDRDYLADFQPEVARNHTELELQIIHVIKRIFESVRLSDFGRFLLLLSTTKGNIDLLENNPNNIDKSRIYLPEMTKILNDYFGFPKAPIVISNACISGVSGILTAKKMIQGGHCDHVLVVGADAFSKFIYSGFQSFMALSDNLCRPYDIKRNGINLGEGVSAILVSNDKEICDDKLALSEITGGGQANDANHISGPSRDGTGLNISVRKAMEEAGIAPSQIGYINAHGTATVYNDEMEAIAFSALQLDKTPLNSLKGYFGHTLGAAGVLETILTIRQLNNGVLLKSRGYEENGVSKPLGVLQANQPVQDLEYALKTASGFGGGNAAIILKKVWN